MTKLKRWFPNKSALLAALLMGTLSAGGGAVSEFTITKKLIGFTGGVGLQGGDFLMNFSYGEPAAGRFLEESMFSLESGYYGGRFGAGQRFQVVQTEIGGPPGYFQDGLQIGVTVQAEIRIVFSDPLDPESISGGLTATLVQDHLARPQNSAFPLAWAYEPGDLVLRVQPTTQWQGNSVYDIAIGPGMKSVNGYALDKTTHLYFLTMADPHEENTITNAWIGNPVPAASVAADRRPPLTFQVESDSLSDFAVILLTILPGPDSGQVDPAILQEANRKAEASGGIYRTPVGLIELSAFNPEGRSLRALSRPATLSLTHSSSTGWITNAPTPVHTSSLALWTLDQEHRLWVKIPGSISSGQTVSAPITRLSVYALMGGPAGSAADTFVFPTPWRPAGPNAGNLSGQTGTEQGGLTFSNLPSECLIKIYTLNGGLVRELHHSDTHGPVAQETWDGTTSGGARAASGVYLWRVESKQDGKSGKLMIIR